MAPLGSRLSFSDLSNGQKGWAYHLTPLYQQCRFSDSPNIRTINFDEAAKKIRQQIKHSFSDIEAYSDKMIENFMIGTAHVSGVLGSRIDPMAASTWTDTEEINEAWRRHQFSHGYDGLVVLTCVTSHILPEPVKRIGVDPFKYATALAQATLHHFMMKKADRRIRDLQRSPITGDGSVSSGYVIYVSYKLQSRGLLEDVKVEPEEPCQPKHETPALDMLEKKLKEEENMAFRDNLPNDGNSFFHCCSDQLARLNLIQIDHAQLRQMVSQQLQSLTDTEVAATNFSKDDWAKFVQDVAKDGSHIYTIVEKTMAEVMQRKLVIYTLSYSNDLTKQEYNQSANGAPMILAKDKHIYKSLQPSRKNKKRPADTPQKTDAPEKQAKGSDFDSRRCEPRTTHLPYVRLNLNMQVNPPGANAPGPSINKTTHKRMTKDEKILILKCYTNLPVKTDFIALTNMVYQERRTALSKEIYEHYEQNLDKSTTLQTRIKGYIQRCQSNKVDEKDEETKRYMIKAGFNVK